MKNNKVKIPLTKEEYNDWVTRSLEADKIADGWKNFYAIASGILLYWIGGWIIYTIFTAF